MNIINDKVDEYIRGLNKPMNGSLAEMRQFAAEHRVPIILPDTEALILNIIRMKKPARILEVGTAIGYSAACFAFADPQCRITTIESNEDALHIAEKNIRKLGLSDRITIRFGEGQTVIPQLEETFDLVFIDAAKSHYREFWDESIKLCSKNAVIICDNVLMKGMTASDEFDTRKKYKTSIRRMREFLTYITEQKIADTAVLPVGDGVSVSIMKG